MLTVIQSSGSPVRLCYCANTDDYRSILNTFLKQVERRNSSPTVKTQSPSSRVNPSEVNTNACLSQSHTGREDVSCPRLAAGKRPASLFPLFLSAATSCPAPRCRQRCVGSQSHGLNHRKHHPRGVCASRTWGNLSCLQNDSEKRDCEEADYYYSHSFPFKILLLLWNF